MNDPGPPRAPARKRASQLELTVAEVRVETSDTVTLVFEPSSEQLEYQAGQFCTVDPHQFAGLAQLTAWLEHTKGKREPPRAYSLSSAPHERAVTLTVTEERYVAGRTTYPPLLSPLLVRQMHRGSRLQLNGFTGPYTLGRDVEAKTDHLVHVVTGSGAAPNFAMLKHALHHGLKLRHTFICENPTWADVCFQAPLAELERQYPQQLHVVHVLTHETDEKVFGQTSHGDLRRGQLTHALLVQLIAEPTGCLVYVCGPAITTHERARSRELGTTPAPRFIETVLELLKGVGVPGERIRRESWG